MTGSYGATLVRKVKHNDSVTGFVFRADPQMRYRAGQYAEIEVTHEDPDNRGSKRWMSFASSPKETDLMIISRISEPPSSFKRALFSLQPGQDIIIDEPMGDFVLPRDTTVPLIFIAGGIGVAPFRGICHEILTTQHSRSISMLYSARSYGDLLFVDSLEKATNQLHLYTTESHPKTRHGHITANKVIEAIEKQSINQAPLIYIAGSAPFVQQLRDGLAGENVDPSIILTDYFFGSDETA
jgi:ferredoxin-NADP reductase